MMKTTELSPLVAQAVNFTETYKQHEQAHPAIREAECLKTQYPGILQDLRIGDTFAGRRPDDVIIYFGTIWWLAYPEWRSGDHNEGKQGGYCVNFAAAEKCAKTPEDKEALTELLDFWEQECSVTKVREQLDQELCDYPRNLLGQINGDSIGFCMALDYDRLLQLGIPGLIDQVQQRKQAAAGTEADEQFLDGLLIMLEVFKNTCRHYRRQAEQLATDVPDADAGNLWALAASLEAIETRPPETLREAIQLFWLYLVLASGKHIEPGRLDVFLGDFYANDIDSGRLTEAEAQELVEGLWRIISECGEPAVSRVVIGGKGRRNEANADRFALAALEATRRIKTVAPQLTLRFHEGQNPELFTKGLEAVGEHGTFPMFYNDDTSVPGAAQSLGISLEEATEYHPLGCGEYMLAKSSPSFICNAWSVPKSLEAVLHNGCGEGGVKIGPETGELSELETYEQLYAAFTTQYEFVLKLAARFYRTVSDTLPQSCSFLFASLLTNDCVERGRALLDGGVRYLGVCEMGHGWTTAADALYAIRRVVYEDKRLSLAELVEILDDNFEGHEDIRRILLDVPKFGNDNDDVDGQLNQMWIEVHDAIKRIGQEAGFDFMVASSVNPGGYGMGKACGATADGRRRGEPFAIAHAPTAGFDKCGLSACLNSVAKTDAAHGGATTNIKLSREMFKSSFAKLKTLFKVYFAKGGMQANITVVSQDDLKAALVHPEQYQHVLVRLGGWTAKFVDLEKDIQEEIIRRTCH